MGNGLLNDFCGAVQSRMKRAGFDWLTLITTLLPVVIEIITNCFNKPSDLQSFAEGKRTPLQLAGLRLRCRRVVQEQGIRGVFRVAAATEALQEAVLAELDAKAATAAGPGIWQEAMDEAASV